MSPVGSNVGDRNYRNERADSMATVATLLADLPTFTLDLSLARSIGFPVGTTSVGQSLP